MQFGPDIKQTSNNNVREPIKQSNYRKKYLFTAHDLIVPSPMMSVLTDNKYYLLEDADTVRLTTDMYYRPDLFCSQTYGDPGVYFVILFVNDMFSFTDFTRSTIKVPTKDRVNRVLSMVESQNPFAEINTTVSLIK
jgi:hypothetical protein